MPVHVAAAAADILSGPRVPGARTSVTTGKLVVLFVLDSSYCLRADATALFALSPKARCAQQCCAAHAALVRADGPHRQTAQPPHLSPALAALPPPPPRARPASAGPGPSEASSSGRSRPSSAPRKSGHSAGASAGASVGSRHSTAFCTGGSVPARTGQARHPSVAMQ